MTGRIRILISAAMTVAFVAVSAAIVEPAYAARPPSAPLLPAAATDHQGGAQKILLYGDSLTMSPAGHWSYRYRLWQGLQAAGTSFEFVGPLHNVGAYPTGTPTMEYRNPNFNTAHAAVGGMTLTNPRWTISDLAGQYRPNVIVSQIGINDLLHAVATPQELADNLRLQIELARRADPGVSFVLVQLGQIWEPGVSAYDALLAGLAASLDRPMGRVVVANAPTLDMYADTEDGIHYTTSGEKLCATAVANALTTLGLPSAPAPADPSDVGNLAPAPSAAVSGQVVTISWPSEDYATSEDIYATDLTTGATGMARQVPGTSMTVVVPSPGHTYEITLKPVQGWAELGTQSLPVTFTAG